MSPVRRIYEPRAARVKVGLGGAPTEMEGVAVESVREEWVVEDRWWTARPLHRHYYELVLANGRLVMAFRDLLSGRWHRH